MLKIGDVSFYKEQYNFEFGRKKEIDDSIKYPTTLLIVLIGAAFFFIDVYDIKNLSNESLWRLAGFIIFISSFVVFMSMTVFHLMRMYVSLFRKYLYLPLTSELRTLEIDLIKYFEVRLSDEGHDDPKSEALHRAVEEFNSDMLDYYVEFTTHNQFINEKREQAYFLSRRYILASIIALILFGLLVITKTQNF